jgi:hypothetical protein
MLRRARYAFTKSWLMERGCSRASRTAASVIAVNVTRSSLWLLSSAPCSCNATKEGYLLHHCVIGMPPPSVDCSVHAQGVFQLFKIG